MPSNASASHSSTLSNCVNFRPSVGTLLELYEENYLLLLRLCPNLNSLQGHQHATDESGLKLHLQVLEQTPYTSLIHLTYQFGDGENPLPDPDAYLRAYHDARQLEVVRLRESALPLGQCPQCPTLQQKWHINLFLSKWLRYCLLTHSFFALEAYPTLLP